jgi:filamentous hemagglutinin
LIYDGTTLAITGAISGSGNISGSAFYGDGSNLTGLSAGVSGSSRHYSATGLETSGFLKVTGSSTFAGDVTIDKDHSNTTAATITGLQVDFDKIGASTSNNTMYGLNIDMDNTTATDGLNTMYGIYCTPTLTHAAAAGTPIVYGALINAQGGTNGTGIAQAARFEAGGGALNYGIQLDVEDGGVDLRIESSADSADYFQIQTTTHGATTITTVDDGAAAADLTFNVDGDIVLNPVGGDVAVAGAISASAPLTVTSISASGESHFSGNVGIGTATPLYDLHVNGAGVTVATIDGGASSDAYLKLATAGTEKGYLKLGSGGNVVLAQDATGGDLLLKAKPGGVSTTYLTLDGGTTTIVAGTPIAAQAIEATAISSSTTLQAVGATTFGGTLTVSGAVSGSGTLYNAAAATFSSTIAATGSVTAVGLYSTELISGSLGMHIDQPASFGGAVVISSSMTAAGVNTTGKISGSLGLHVDQASTFGNTLYVTGNVGIGGSATMPLDVQSDSVPHARFANTANDANGAVVRIQNTRGTSNAGQADDFCGGLSFLAQDSGADSTQYSKISTKIGSPTNTAEAGYMLFEVTTAGTAATSYLNLNGLKTAITASVDTHIQGATHQSGAHYRKFVAKDTDYTLTNADNIVYIGHGLNNLTASLPDASTVNGIVYTIKNANQALVVVKPNGSQMIDGMPAMTGTIGMAWTLAAQDDVWMILSSHSSSI